MASMRDIKRKISSVKSTQKITKTMYLVAGAKLRRAQESILQLRPYAFRMQEMIASLAMRANPDLHPLLAEREETTNTCLVVVTADRGLCGAFNANILKKAEAFVRDEEAQGRKVDLIVVGNRGIDFFSRRPQYNVVHTLGDIFSKTVKYEDGAQVADLITAKYVKGEWDSVSVVYNEFKSAIRQDVILEKLLPIVPMEAKEGELTVDYIYEPSPEEVLDELLPLYFRTEVFRVFLESAASEHAARMTAMDNATNNAEEVITNLTLVYNKARQAAITNEILEVVGGAEALNQ